MTGALDPNVGGVIEPPAQMPPLPEGATLNVAPAQGSTPRNLRASLKNKVLGPNVGGVIAPPEQMPPLPEGATLNELPFSLDGSTYEPKAPIRRRSTPAELLLDRTSAGRVLDAFGQGAAHGWGVRPLGLTPDADKALREANLFNSIDGLNSNVLKAFNEVLMRPAAIALDALMRGVSAVTHSVAGGGGVLAVETGVAAPGTQGRVTRDLMALAETVGVLSLAGPPTGPRASRAGRADADAARAERATDAEAGAARAGRAADAEAGAARAGRAADAEAPLPRELDMAGNINMNRINAPDDIKDVIRRTAEANGGFIDARRGKITLQETEEMAAAIGMTPEKLAKRNIGEAFNAEELTASRVLLVNSATNLKDLARRATVGDDAAVISFQEGMLRHAMIQEHVAGMTAEAGRALSAMRIAARSTAVGEAGDLARFIEKFGGHASIKRVAEAIDSFETSAQVSKFAMELRGSSFKEKFMEAWISGLLSGLGTHSANIMGNTIAALMTIPENTLASAIGGARRTLGSTGERIAAGEVAASAWGMVQGMREGAATAARVFRDGLPEGSISKIELHKPNAIPGKIGTAIRTPLRALSAEDEFFSAMARRSELNAQSYRIANREELQGEAFAARVEELRANPTRSMLSAMDTAADYLTFRTPLGESGQALQQLTNSSTAFKVVVPFVRTPINLIKYAAERTPVGFAFSAVRDNLRGVNGSIARDKQAARMALGTMIGGAVATYAADGMITGGGPTDPRERAMRHAAGIPPYSVKIGEHYYSYARLEPFALIIGVAADLVEISRSASFAESDKVAALVVGSLAKNLTSKTWLSGPSSLIQAITDPERYGERWVNRTAGSVIPSISAQIARHNDPYMREASSIIEAFKARIPGLSQDLLPRRDVWGQPVKATEFAGVDLISPIAVLKMRDDPVNQELQRLRFFPARVDRTIHGVRLDARQYDELQELTGKLAKYRLDQIVALPGFTERPEYVRTEVIRKTIESSRESSRQLMIARHPELIQKMTDARLKKFGPAPSPETGVPVD